MTTAEREALRQDLIRDEGLRLSAYQDHLGFWTIGVGRLIDARKGGRISAPEAMVLLDNDIRVCMEDLAMFPWFQRLNGPRQRAVLNMRFQLGSGGFRGFTQMRAALEAGDPELAAVRARQSKWFRVDTPERAARVTTMLEIGAEV
jgi:lysozyme